MNEATLQYVRQHADDDVRQLALRGTKEAGVDLTAALEQIAGRQTARRKLPSWAAVDGVLYPPRLSMEQCSSEPAARYKAELAQRLTAGIIKDGTAQSTFVDLTGGLGIDFSFISRSFSRSVYVERQEHLCQLARHNFPLLGIEAEVVCGDAADFLQQMEPVSLIFIDPARRDSHGARTYGIADCTPDVLLLLDALRQKASHILLKLSPMLDWRKAVADLGEQWVSEVHIVSVGGECKEMLVVVRGFFSRGRRLVSRYEVRGARYEDRLNFDTPRKSQHCSKTDLPECTLYCVNLLSDGTSQIFTTSSPHTSKSDLVPRTSHLVPRTNLVPPSSFLLPRESFPRETTRKFLYEPNASIMKAGCFEALAAAYGVSPIAENSHLFLSDQLISDFPGRCFQIESVCSVNEFLASRSSFLEKTHLASKCANITVRNFPLSVAELRKRLKLSEGGSTYIFATTLANGKHVLFVTLPPQSSQCTRE